MLRGFMLSTDYRRRWQMPLDKQDLAAGTALVGTYKKAEHRVLVLGEPGPEQGYELDGETVFKSLSSAAKAVMGGISANGWRFWTLEGEAQAKASAKAEKAASKPRVPKRRSKSRMVKIIKRLPNQKGAPEGETKWFCSGCMAAFVTPGTEMPETCPEGHPRVEEDILAPTEAVAADPTE